MKKVICAVVVSFCVVFAFAQSSQNPVYWNGLVGTNVVEFAANGANKDLIAELEPYIVSGRVYFLCFALPLSTGNLRSEFEFNLDMNYESGEFMQKPRVIAFYRGSQRDTISEGQTFSAAGYAERGRIVITHVFTNYETLEEWANNVKLAFN